MKEELTEKNRIIIPSDEREMIETFLGDAVPFSNIVTWNTLMPLVEKISKHKYDDFEGNTDYAFFRTFGMLDEEGLFMVRINRHSIHYGETLLLATYQAVLEFVLYNKHLALTGE